MIQIRNGVFETNSSSSHSIVIEKNDKPIKETVDTWRIRNDGTLWFWSGDLEFGRSPFDLLTDWYGRMCYVIASYGESIIEELQEICQRRIKDFKQFLFEKDYDSGKNYYGDVDHQSDGLLRHFLGKNNVSLEDFIFNDRYIVVIDGDEYNIFEKFKETDMFNKDALIKEE